MYFSRIQKYLAQLSNSTYKNLKFGQSYELAEFKNIWPNCRTVLTLAILRWFARKNRYNWSNLNGLCQRW